MLRKTPYLASLRVVASSPAAVLDAEALGHGDLDGLDVVAVPERLQHRVGEPEVEQLLQAHLAQEVVDPVELALVHVLVHLLVQRAGRGAVVAERLLDDDASSVHQVCLGEPADHGAEERRRDLQVVDGSVRGADRGRQSPVGVRVREVAAQVGEAPGKPLEHRIVDRLAAGRDHLAGVLAETIGGPVVDRDAHDGRVEQPAAIEPVERPQRHLPGQVTGDPEDDEHVAGAVGPFAGSRPVGRHRPFLLQLHGGWSPHEPGRSSLAAHARKVRSDSRAGGGMERCTSLTGPGEVPSSTCSVTGVV